MFSGGIKAVAHLMHEFVLEMRYRWENAILLPGLPEGIFVYKKLKFDYDKFWYVRRTGLQMSQQP